MSAIRITGSLARDAELRFSTDGAAWLILEIHQGPGALPVQARRRIGTGPAAAIAARSSASHLRRGSRVTVHADTYAVEYLPTPHLVLSRVDVVEHQPIAPRHEPDEPRWPIQPAPQPT